jgi:molybdate transport system substrate-binding protein
MHQRDRGVGGKVPIPRLPAWLIAASLALGFVATSPVGAAEIHVMLSGGFAAAYDELVPAYEKASGNTVVTERGPSMGDTPQAIPNRLARGEPADVVIMVDAGLDRLIEQHLAVAGSRVDLANAKIWLAVKAGAVRPDISNVDAFTNTLRHAKSIAYSDSASGVYLEKTLLPKIDPDGSIRAKSRMIPAEPVGRVVARGEAELGFQQKSELQPVAGITIVGPIPDAVQKSTTFVAGIASTSREPEAAHDLIRFLASRDAQPAIIKSGMDPVSATMTKAPPASQLKSSPQGVEMTREPVPGSR